MMPTFYSIGVSIGIGRATKKGRNKDRGSQDADGLLPLLGNQLEKTKKKETEKQRGRLVVRLLLLERHQKKSRRRRFDRSSLRLIVRSERQKK